MIINKKSTLMSSKSKFRVTFRVIHPSMTSRCIEAQINLVSKLSQSVGEPKESKGGKQLGGVYRKSHVSFPLHEKPIDFDSSDIEPLIINAITKFDIEFVRSISSSGGECYFSLGIYSEENASFSFSPDLLKQLADINTWVKFDFYGGED